MTSPHPQHDLVAMKDTLEQLLKEQTERLSHVIEGTAAGIWEWNVQTGEIRYNERWANIIGYSLEELGETTSSTWTHYFHPEDLKRSEALLTRMLRGDSEFYECEARMLHRNKQWIWVLDRGKVITRTPDGKPEWVYGTHLDITSLKRQEEALRAQQYLLDRVSAVAGVGSYTLDLATQHLYWSDQTKLIHAVSLDYEPTLEAAINFYAPEARPVIQSAVAQAILSGSKYDVELPLVRADGESIWVRAVGEAEYQHGTAVRLIGAFQDVTAARNIQARLFEQKEMLRVTLASIGDGVITTDAQANVTWLNPVAEHMTGWKTEEAEGRPLTEVFRIVNEVTRLPVTNPVQTCLEQGTIVGLANHTMLLSKNGHEYGIADSAAPIRNDNNDVLGVVLVFHDVTEQRRLSDEIHYRATHDSLTGLINRSEFEKRLQRSLQHSQDFPNGSALLYIDLDQFKIVNDTCGHSVGDELLQQVAALISDSVRGSDTLARLGGDEFALLLENCDGKQARKIAQSICDRMEQYRFIHEDRRFSIGASIGLVPVDGHWRTMAEVLQAADAACYAAKDAGRNRVHVWRESDKTLLERHGDMEWATRLQHAFDEDGFVLFAQKIAPIATEEHALHCEILLRLKNADGGLVSPALFFPAAERFHQASRIDRWVLNRVVGMLSNLPSLDTISMISVNVSGQSVGDRAFHRYATELLADAGPAICQKLCLELTETTAISGMADACSFIERVRALGVRVALDDFGAGASFFGYLKQLNVDYLKIDGQFIRDLLDDPLDEVAVRCFIEVASTVGIQTVAEFVDQPQVLERLAQLGVDYAQGYLLHKPEPFERILVG